ncbi:hypothetical protein HK405_009091 [Cladochytrium tenue]|nr:hypothetical protein HK405_009091 [Cladochytrium tenue]
MAPEQPPLQSTPPRAVRWGFAGSGRISRDFATALGPLVSAGRARLQACAARDAGSAKAFASALGVATVHKTYAGLCGDSEVDVVYVGTLHTSHAELARLALEGGKHVLVEKPMAMNAGEAAGVVALAKEKGLFFLEGVWTRFFPAIRYVRKQIADGQIGEVQVVQAQMGFAFDRDNDRLWKRSMGGGGLLDIGIYPLTFATMVFGTSPEKVTAVGRLSEDEGVDVYGSVTLEYGAERFATLQYSMYTQMAETVTIMGSKGRILIQPPAHAATSVVVTKYRADGSQEEAASQFAWPAVEPGSAYCYGGSQAFLYEAEAVTDAILANQSEIQEYTPAESLGVMKIMDEIRKQLGLVYPADRV